MKNLVLTLVILLAFVFNGMAQRGSFAPQGAEWYFNLSSFMGSPISYYHMEVLDDTIIQGHDCSVITQQFLGGNGQEQYVYEDNGKVYWYNQTIQAFTTLYDFNADEGDSWICDIDSCSFVVHVQSVEEVTWEGHTYRVQWVTSEGGEYNDPAFDGAIIEGIGYERGLFPYPWACSSSIYCGGYTDYMRCYLFNDEMLYHEGNYDCEEYGYCWDGTVANDFAGGDGTEENPYLIANAKQLAMFAQRVNIGMGSDAYYKLTENINLEKCDGGYQQWESIGTVVHPFAGHFDGDGHTIMNLSQNITNGNSQVVAGLFGCTNGAEISNVHLVQCYVSGNGKYVGTLVGYAGLTDIYDCSIYDGRASTDKSAGRAGGLIGFAGYTYGVQEVGNQTCIIARCVVGEAVKVETTAVEGSIAGGVVGQINDVRQRTPYVLEGCEMRGTVDDFCVRGSSCAGGVVGSIYYGTMVRCTNNQKVVVGRENSNPGGCAGGLAGMVMYGTVTECLNNESGQVSCAENARNCNTGGIVGALECAEDGGYIRNCQNLAEVAGSRNCGGIVAVYYLSHSDATCFVQGCQNYAMVTCHHPGASVDECAGGIVGTVGQANGNLYIVECSNYGDVTVDDELDGNAGGILGSTSLVNDYVNIYILNAFNRGSVSTRSFAGGILGGNVSGRNCTIQNVYNTGEVITSAPTKGAIAYAQLETDYFSDCYWLDRENHASVSEGEPLQHSCAFRPTTNYGEWSLDSLQFGHDLVEALNIGAEALVEQYPAVLTLVHRWEYDVDNINDGYPVLSGIEMVGYPFDGKEWYYEIQNENGSITYQHLEYAADTTVNGKTVVIIIRTNTLYDKGEHQEVTREYLYEEDGVVYWWNKDLQEFTTLYDFGAEAGDEWEIKVGLESITMHVDSVKYYEYNGELYKTLMVSDENGIFSGNIVCGIGHQTSFFPERLMTRGKNYRVEGIRCYWREGELMFKYGDKDCDAVYQEYHNGIEEPIGNDGFIIYPNPSNGLITISGMQSGAYRIANIMGQTVQTGNLNDENQRIDVSSLPKGMYFITFADETQKFVLQ